MLKYTTDPVFGKCVEISNSHVELRISTEFGPRVIHCSCAGMENMFYEDKEKAPLGEKYETFDDQIILYGGHRLWLSPEVVPRCYHPDNLPVTVSEVEGGARFTAAVEKHNGIQKSITVTLEPDSPHINVSHSIRNVGLWDIELAPWAITMLAPGGTEIMPMPSRVTELLPNRNFTFWDYSELDDPRLHLGKKYISLRQDPSKQNPFKLGYNNEAGWAAYFNKGQVFLKYFEPTIGGFYPDNGCCFETYTNGNMLEMESLGEMFELEPDDFITLEEEWELYTANGPTNFKDEDELERILRPWALPTPANF